MDLSEIIQYFGAAIGVVVLLAINWLSDLRGKDKETGDAAEADAGESLEQIPAHKMSAREMPGRKSNQKSSSRSWSEWLAGFTNEDFTFLRQLLRRSGKSLAERERDEKLRPYRFPGKSSANRTLKNLPSRKKAGAAEGEGNTRRPPAGRR